MWEENVIKEKVKILVLHPTERDSLVDPLAVDCKNEESKEELVQEEKNAKIVNPDVSGINSTKKQERSKQTYNFSSQRKYICM